MCFGGAKNALRSGDIWVPGSRQFRDFEDICCPQLLSRCHLLVEFALAARKIALNGEIAPPRHLL